MDRRCQQLYGKVRYLAEGLKSLDAIPNLLPTIAFFNHGTGWACTMQSFVGVWWACSPPLATAMHDPCWKDLAHASGSGTDSMRSSESMSERFPPVHETEPTLPGRAIRFAAEMAFVDGWSQGGR